MTILADFRHAVRALQARPGFTALAIITLALGIGANTAMFSGVFHTLIRPLPFETGDRLVHVRQKSEAGMMIPASGEQFDAWQGRTRHLEALAKLDAAEFTVLSESEPQLVSGGRIGRGILPLVKLAPIQGRNFTEEEMQYGAPRVALISESFWKSQFGGRADIIGATLRLSDGAHTIVGVVPNALGRIDNRNRQARIWVPLRGPASTETVRHSFHGVVGVLREGSTVVQAEQELNLLISGLKPQLAGKWSIAVITPKDQLDSGTRKAIPILFGAVAMVLLIACANLAGLLLVRLNSRRRELAVRAALGAGRMRIIRHVWVEALLLAMLGAGTGVLLASWGVDLMKLIAPRNLAIVEALRIDANALIFACALAFLTSLLFAAAPALHLARADLISPLATGAGAGSRVTDGGRLRSVLVVGQIAVSLVLLVGASLLIRSVWNLQDQPLGFEPERVLRVGVQLPQNRYSGREARSEFVRELERRIEQIPGVERVTFGSGVPSEMGMIFGEYQPEPEGDGRTPPVVNSLTGGMVDGSFFQLLGIRLLEGRTWSDQPENNVVVINRELAESFWPGQSAVGKRLRPAPQAPLSTVVGVIDNFAVGGLRTSKTEPQLYSPTDFDWSNGYQMLVRTRSEDPLTVLPQIRHAIHSLDPELPLRNVTTLAAMLTETIARERFNMMLISTFAFLAFTLSLVGLYSVISQAVTRRTGEIGIRMALGATPASVRGMVLREGVALTVIGLVIGGAMGVAAVRLLSALLQGVAPRDPISFTLAALILAAGGIFACWLPAHRATKVDPLEALRAE